MDRSPHRVSSPSIDNVVPPPPSASVPLPVAAPRRELFPIHLILLYTFSKMSSLSGSNLRIAL